MMISGEKAPVAMENSTRHIIGATAEPGPADARAQTARDNYTGMGGMATD